MDQDKAMFPCGANLSALVNDDSITGALELPLPFEGDDVLSLQWTRVEGLFISDEFAHQWGYTNPPQPSERVFYLGRFSYNGKPLNPPARAKSHAGVEHFHECRFDVDGNDSMGSNMDFNGEDGFHVSSILEMLPPEGHFSLNPKGLKLVDTLDGDRKLYMGWVSHGGSRWTLELRTEQEIRAQRVYKSTYEAFAFDLFERELTWEYNYQPTDL